MKVEGALGQKQCNSSSSEGGWSRASAYEVLSAASWNSREGVVLSHRPTSVVHPLGHELHRASRPTNTKKCGDDRNGGLKADGNVEAKEFLFLPPSSQSPQQETAVSSSFVSANSSCMSPSHS